MSGGAGASHIGREAEFQALGRTWRAGRATRAVWDAFLAWARPRIPDPLEVGRKALALYPEGQHAAIVRLAMEEAQAYLSIGSPQVMRALGSLEGMGHMLWLLLRPNHPGITEDEAFDIVMDLGLEKFRQTLEATGGKVPAAAEGKGQAPGA